MENSSDPRSFANHKVFSQELQNSLKLQGDEIQKAIVGMEKRCYSRARDNDETFVDCMYDASNKLEREQRDLELRTAFFQAQYSECVENSNQSIDSIKKCQNDASVNMQRVFTTFIDNLQF